MKKQIWFFLFLISMGNVHAMQGHMKLLAVRDTGLGYEGASADLYLEIKPGSGRVFLDTFPLTKVDTQISTRLAKEVACNYLNKNCDKYDFIYTIRSDSSIVAGPSAGAAIAILTISLLDGFKLNESISITGTINSGGVIGSVGGIKEKIDAARRIRLKKVLIPRGERFIREERMGKNGSNDTNTTNDISNETLDIVEYGKKMGINIIEVSDLGEALYEFTGKRFEENNYSLIIDEGYKKIMRGLAIELCNRSKKLFNKITEQGLNKSIYNSSISVALNLSRRGDSAIAKGRYYSAASYCFGSNVRLTEVLFRNLTSKEIENKISLIERNIERLDGVVNKKKKKTITDLESYMVVEERLIEAKEYKKEIKEKNIENVSNKDIYRLAYSYERVYSAFSWYKFFVHIGREINLDKNSLRKSCEKKLSEAEERRQYVIFFYPSLKETSTKREIEYAYKDLKDGRYELCLFKATKAKAESDIVLSVSGITKNKLDVLIKKKLEIAKKNIVKQIRKGNFPILGYSYYEYANDLKDSDKYSALLYAEYALELSNLDVYFKQEGISYLDYIKQKAVYLQPIYLIVLGIVIGFLAAGIMVRREYSYKKRKTKKRKRTYF